MPHALTGPWKKIPYKVKATHPNPALQRPPRRSVDALQTRHRPRQPPMRVRRAAGAAAARLISTVSERPANCPRWILRRRHPTRARAVSSAPDRNRTRNRPFRAPAALVLGSHVVEIRREGPTSTPPSISACPTRSTRRPPRCRKSLRRRRICRPIRAQGGWPSPRASPSGSAKSGPRC